MKLRIRGNSLRLRLSQSEVVDLASKGRVVDAIAFGPAKLTYELVLAERPDIGAMYTDATITVTVPTSRGRAWASSDEVGIEHDDGKLRILVEKDFACLKPRTGEDDTDAYPNPSAGRT